MKISVSLIILLAALLSLGQVNQKKMRMYKNPKAMKQEIEKQMPIGSKIEDSQRIMEANGFRCVWKDGGSFTEGTEDKPEAEHNGLNFLYCRKVKQSLAGFLDPRRLFYMRLWEVGFVEKDGVVSDIFVYVGWDCEL